MIESQERSGFFFVADEELSEAIEPGVGDLDDPAPWLVGRVFVFVCNVLTSGADVRDVTMRTDSLRGGLADKTGIKTEVFRHGGIAGGLFDHFGVEQGFKLGDIMPVGAAHGQS